jgi:excisionase family DNA binding protein
MTSQTEALWTWKEVATYLKASRSWVYQRAEDGTLPSLRIGGFLRFDPSTVRAWALNGASTATVIPLKGNTNSTR